MGAILGLGVTHVPPLAGHDWMCLAGAMAELGRQPTEIDLIETYIFNSSTCFAFDVRRAPSP